MTKKGRPFNPAEYYTFKGETRTMKQWADELGWAVCTLRQRYAKYKAGDISTLDEVFTPRSLAKAFSKDHQLVKTGAGASVGKRVICINALFTEFVKEGLPRLPEEMKHYMATGERGNAMQFYLAYKDFFPRDKIEALDGESTKPLAALSVVFQSEPPKDITLLEQ